MRHASLLALLSITAVAHAGAPGPLFLSSGSVTIEEGDVYTKLFISDTAEVIMNGGEVLGEALAISGGRIEFNGGAISLTSYSMSGSLQSSVSEFVVRGGVLESAAFGIGGASNVTIEAAEFFVDADRDGVSDTPILMPGGTGVITADSDFYDASEQQPIVGLRWVYPDGGEETVNLPIIGADEAWTGSITLVRVGAYPADFNGDGAVDSNDLAIMLAAWGTADADLTGDNLTDSSDLAVLLAAWGA